MLLVPRAGYLGGPAAFASSISCRICRRDRATNSCTTSSASWRGSGGGVAGLVLDVFHHVDQHLGRAQIGTRRFVDHLRDDRLALGDLAARPSSVATTVSFSAAASNAGRLLVLRPPGLPDCPFLKRLCSGGLPGPTL